MDIIYNSPWLLSEATAKEYLSIYENYHSTKEHPQPTMTISDSWEPRIIEDTAIIPITGIIMRYANNINTVCGTPTSTGLLYDAIKQYANDDTISTIILDIDSPGGDARGISDLATFIRETTKIKPVIAVATGQCASGAYWIASACSKIYASDTSMIGSIGVVACYRKDEEQPIQEIVSSQSPNKRLNIDSEEGKAIIQNNIDDIADVFITSVGKYRNMTNEEVIQAGNKGATLIASKALKNKLIDEIGSVDTVLSYKEKLMSDKEIKKTDATVDVISASNIDLEELRGSISEEVYSKIETMVTQMNHQTEVIKAQQADLQAKHQELMKQSFITKAEKEFPNLTGTAEEKGSLLMALETLSTEHKTYILGLMQQVNTQTTSMMNTLSNNIEKPVVDDFDEKVETLAKEIMSVNAGMSIFKARSLAMRELGK